MLKNIYASGFLFHPASQQILLQQAVSSLPTLSPWSLLNGFYTQDENPDSVFKNAVSDLLGVQVHIAYPVYSYFNENTGMSQFIFYSELPRIQDFVTQEGLTFSWFSFKNVLKLNTSEQTKHDIVVGKRVIEASERRRLGLHTF